MDPFAGPQQAADPQQLEGEWDSWLSSPANKAALMSFGLNLMGGGWGTPVQQFADAMGAGVRAQSATYDINREEQLRQEGISRKQQELDEKHAHELELQGMRGNQAERVARIGAESRESVANIRSKKFKTPEEAGWFAYSEVYKQARDSSMIGDPVDWAKVEQDASTQRKRAEGNWRVENAGEKSSANPAAAPGQGGGPDGAPAPKKSSANPNKLQELLGAAKPRTWAELEADPSVDKRALETIKATPSLRHMFKDHIIGGIPGSTMQNPNSPAEPLGIP